VIIGVGAVVAMMALGSARAFHRPSGAKPRQQLAGCVSRQRGHGGSPARARRAAEPDLGDAQAIAATVPEVEAVEAEYGRTAQVVYAGANTATTVIGVEP